MKTFNIKFKNFKVTIKDITEKKVTAYMAVIPALNNSLVFGNDLKELTEGIDLTINLAEKKGKKAVKAKKSLVKV